jgi:hypothetical protein
MNIVHLEGQLKALMKQRKQAEKGSEPNRYDLEFFNIERTLYGIKNDVHSDIFVWKLLRKDLGNKEKYLEHFI